MAQPGYIKEYDSFAVEKDGVERTVFNVAPRESKARRPSKPNNLDSHPEPLSPTEFTLLWLLLLGLHGLCAAYLLAMAMLYFFLENPLMAYYTNLLALPKYRYFRTFGTLVGILGALHGLQLFLHLVWSVRSRAPAVWPRAAAVDRVVKFFKRLKRNKFEATKPSSPRSRSSISAISSFTMASLESVLSVEGNNFALIFMIRKAFEASAQIVQCHRYSTLIGRLWINHAYAAMVVVNCWVTPMLDYLMFSSDSRVVKRAASTHNVSNFYAAVSVRGRAICVSIDTLLTAVFCLILPLAIFVPYARSFNTEWYSFPYEVLYGDVAFPNLVRENQALFALNFVDAVTKLVPHLSILFGMASTSLLLELYPPMKFKRRSNAVTAAITSIAVRSQPQVTRLLESKSVGLTFSRRALVPLAFASAGAAVLGLHLYAAYVSTTANSDTMKMCLQSIRPWFAQNVSCSVIDYNCYTHGVVTPPVDALDHLQSDAVTAVVFEHCEAFEMPPSIRRFSNLLGLELWNITMVRWGEDAALNEDLHPKMIFLVMVYMNMTEMPRGVLTPPLPPLLGDIEIAVTNIARIPDELADAWSNVRLVYLENTPLEEFPTALFRIPSLSVSLLNDGLEAIPNDLFTTVSLLDEYLELTFSYNPITSLPASLRDGLLINYLDVDHTNVTQLPAWINQVGQWISLGGTLLCNDTAQNLPSKAGCYDGGWDPIRDGRYPLNLVQASRQIDKGN